MITWIQKTFHEQFRWVFIALLVASLLAFVFVNNASVGFGIFQSKAEKRPFFGINLADKNAIERIQRDASISVFSQFGSAPPQNERLQQLALKRYALVHAADQMRLPRPSPAAVEERIKTMRHFKDDRGNFDTSKYIEFQIAPKNVTKLDMTFGDFFRVTGDDLRIDQLQKLISGPGYVLPQDVLQILRQNETAWTLVSASIDFTNALKPVDAGKDQVMRHFEENRTHYAIAPQVRVDYIEFPFAQFLDSVKLTEAEVRAFYDANPARFPRMLTPKTLGITKSLQTQSQTHDQNYELMRANAEALLRQQRAQTLASTAASDLAFDLDKHRIQPGTKQFNELLEKNRVSVKPLPAFSRDTPPEHFGRSSDAIAREAFALGVDARYSNPVATSQGAILLVWQESIPERPAEFSEVAEKARSDYMDAERKKQIQAIGQRIRQRAGADIAAGVPFHIAITKAAVSEGSGVTTKNHPPFSLRQHDPSQAGPNALEIDRNLMKTLASLGQGQMSDMGININDNTGRFLYVRDAKYPDIPETDPKYIQIERTLLTQRANATFDAFVADLVDAELKKSAKKK